MSDLRDDLLFSDALKNLSCNSAEILFDKSYEDKNILVGKLWCRSKKGKESASFEYEK